MSHTESPTLRQHRLSEPHGSTLGPYIHDLVYGANDGIVTTFAVVSGSSGADLVPFVVLVLGFANLFADGLSMGLGNFLSIRSKQDNYHRVLKEEYREIEEIPDVEREEVEQIYAAKGFKGDDLKRVVAVITANKKVWADTMMREEHGMAEEDADYPALHGLVTFLSFVVFGSIPLIPFFTPVPAAARFPIAIVGTAMALLIVGLLRSWVTRERMFKGPVEILSVGLVCAAVAYGIGVVLRGFANGAL